MSQIEQAIFTVRGADAESLAAGQILVATSGGISAADSEELATWSVSHESVPPDGSWDFYALPSGAFAVCRTVRLGKVPSGGYVTRGLVVPASSLARFANNPFALMRAAEAAGAFEVSANGDLAKLDLPGRAAVVDEALLTELLAKVGDAEFIALLDAAISRSCVALTGPVPSERLIEGLLNCLPMECRVQLFFSTARRLAAYRRFRLLALPGKPDSRRWLAEQPGVAVVDLYELSNVTAAGPWTTLIARVLAARQFAFLAAALSASRPSLRLEDLPALATQLIGNLESGTAGDAARSPLRAHAGHQRFEKSQATPAAVAAHISSPSQSLQAESPEILQRLELLDDAVYEAIVGDAAALDRLKLLWPALRKELSDDSMADAREQYLRFALAIWEDCLSGDSHRDPARAVQALDVLCTVFDEV